MPSVILQQIIVRWTKASRGGTNASKRNAVADAFQLAEIPQHNFQNALIHHQLTFTEEIGFVSPSVEMNVEQLQIPLQLTELACMRFQVKPDVATFQPLENMTCLGAPRRNLVFKRMELSVGQWGRFMLNGRFGFANEWSYQKMVTNIAFVETVDRDIFLGEPDQFIQAMADLW